MKRGMLQIRINVMELGRFTAAREFPEGRPEHSLIILHGEGERNWKSELFGHGILEAMMSFAGHLPSLHKPTVRWTTAAVNPLLPH